MGYVAYYRVSTKAQGESRLGLEGQQAIVEHFAHDGEIVAQFTDVASGSTTNGRKELAKAIALCQREGHLLIVGKADRLSRSVKDALTILENLDGKLVCCDCPNTDKFTLTLIFAVAERERELISIRTKAALDAKRRREGKQKINGSPQNLTDAARWKGRIVRTELAQERNHQARTMAKEMRIGGRSLNYIADKLNHSGMTTSRGCQFQATSVARLIKQQDLCPA